MSEKLDFGEPLRMVHEPFSSEPPEWHDRRGKPIDGRQDIFARMFTCTNACAGMADPVTELAQLRARVAELEASRARLAASVRAADNVKVCMESLGGDANTADLLVFYCLAKEANDQYDAARADLTAADLA